MMMHEFYITQSGKMKKILTWAAVFALALAGVSQAQLITGASSSTGKAVHGGMIAEGSPAMTDRGHVYKEIPPFLAGQADYVKVANGDKNVANYTLTVTLAANADVYLFIDTRVDMNTKMAWVGTMGFADTGSQIGLDEGADGSINNRYKIYKKSLAAGTCILREQAAGDFNMYGVAATIPTPPPPPPPGQQVDLDELATLSQDWLETGFTLLGDFYRDGTADVQDAMFLADNWLDPWHTGTGLTGKYYNDTLAGPPEHHAGKFETLIRTRIDPQIDFNWGAGSPDPNVNNDYFSIRWTGRIQPRYTGTYTFYVASYGGATLRINNRLLLEQWHPNWSVKTGTGTFDMVAGQTYAIDLTYYTINTNASCKFEWSCGSQQPRQVVPQECLYPEYSTAILAYPQIGWAPGVKKVITLTTTHSIPSPRYRVYSSAGRQVLTGTMQSRGSFWGNYHYTADLSALIQEDRYSLFVDDHAWGKVPVSRTAYTDIYSKNGSVGITDMVSSFWAFQRSKPAVFPDVDLPLVQRVWAPDPADPNKQIAVESVIGVSGDISGGWHDASSKDKSNIEMAFSMSNMCYALDLMTDPADRTALLGELRWGTDYLLRIQKADGSFFAYMPDNPRKVWANKSPGVVGECARALAAASAIYQGSDPAYAQRCLAAAELAWTWIEANPNDFQRGLISSGWCGYAGNVLGAAVELARATGLQKYKDYVTTQIQNGQYTDQGGWISKTTVKFPGQSDGWFGMDNDAYTGKSVIALCRFYPIADAATKTMIANLCRQYVAIVKKNANNPYSVWSKVFYSWFGFNQNLLSVSHCLLHVGMLFNDTEALDIGMRNFEWSVGFNPLGGTSAPGLGGDLIVPMFSRSTAQSLGGIQPGMLYINNKLSTWYGISWNIWVIGETGLGSSPIVDILAMLNHYAAAASSAPAAPTGLTGSVSDQACGLAWNTSFGATSYSVKRSTTSGSGYEPIANVSSLSYTDTSVSGGTTYYYVVSANNPFGQSGNSGEVALRVLVNVARNKTTSASSNENDTNTHAKAVDGTLSTRWSSQYSDPQWWQVDMGAVYTINKFRIQWEAAAAQSYNIQVSTNGSSWTTVYSTTNCPGGIETVTIAPVSARYVKMNGIARKTKYGYSFWELEVFGY